jgi:hypothetical protein
MAGWAQNATITREAALHRDASGRSKTVDHLESGERVVLVEPSLQDGFYHVRTEEDEIGWVSSKFVSISASAKAIAPQLLNAPVGSQCDASLWDHVYHPQRLIVQQPCMTVIGTIVDATNGKQSDGVRHEGDGDTHGWLKLDPGEENLLNAGNISDEGGNLVFEIVCKFTVKQADAKAACQGFKDHVILPPVGSHVRITGTYVQDTFHAQWMEIHPVTNITVIQ